MTPLELATRYVGEVAERAGSLDHPLIVWWLSLTNVGVDAHDEVPWCSAFVNGVCWELRAMRSKSAAARSWLGVGVSVALQDAAAGWDVVVLDRPPNPASGHVGFYAGVDGDSLRLVSGNVRNGVTIDNFPISRLLGIRRLTVR